MKLAVFTTKGIPSPTDVFAVTKQLYCEKGLRSVKIVASDVPFTTALIMGTFIATICSGFAGLADLLQYTSMSMSPAGVKHLYV